LRWAKLLPGVAVIAADQTLKGWVESHLVVHQRVALGAQQLLSITRSLNAGLIFNWGSGLSDDWLTWVTRALPAATLLPMAILTFLLRKRLDGTLAITTSLFWGGALSNAIELCRGRFVTDTLLLYLGDGRYLPYNPADLAILVGALGWCGLFVGDLFHRRQPQEPVPPLITRYFRRSSSSCR